MSRSVLVKKALSVVSVALLLSVMVMAPMESMQDEDSEASVTAVVVGGIIVAALIIGSFALGVYVGQTIAEPDDSSIQEEVNK